jgi:hypothetical protein
VLGTTFGRVQRILKEGLKMRGIALPSEWGAGKSVSTGHAWKGPRIPFQENTGDGMWVYTCEPETKQHSVEEPFVSTTKKGKTISHKCEELLVGFCDIHRVMCYEFVP